MSSTRKYNIIKDRVEIYKDFTFNLMYYIQHYYIDYESLSQDGDIYNHFKWCFNKVCVEFALEDIDFSENNALKEYFYAYYYHQFYRVKNDSSKDTTIQHFEKFWGQIFEIDKQRNKNLINILIEIYQIYDISINREKNILEIV